MQFLRLNAVLVHINKVYALACLQASWDASPNSRWSGKSFIRQRRAIGLGPSMQIRMNLTGSNQSLSKILFPFAISWFAWSSLIFYHMIRSVSPFSIDRELSTCLLYFILMDYDEYMILHLVDAAADWRLDQTQQYSGKDAVSETAEVALNKLARVWVEV